MRRVLEHDVKAAAVALARIPEPEQPRIFWLWLQQADWAHKVHKRTGKPHPVWGNGSLYQAMHFHGSDPFEFANPDHCSALEYILRALSARKRQSPPQRAYLAGARTKE